MLREGQKISFNQDYTEDIQRKYKQVRDLISMTNVDLMSFVQDEQ